MSNTPKAITCSTGHLYRAENGLIYYEKVDYAVTDREAILEVLKAIYELDDSGSARIVVIQGQPVSYSFDAKQLFFAAPGIAKVTSVCRTANQEKVFHLMQKIGRLFKSPIEIGVFRFVDEAERWIQSESFQPVRQQGYGLFPGGVDRFDVGY